MRKEGDGGNVKVRSPGETLPKLSLFRHNRQLLGIQITIAKMCFVNLDPQKTNCRDDKNNKKLASVSPDLPKLVELLTVHQPKENEILLLGGLGSSETCQTHPHSPLQVSELRI
ncbi:hypothetical protein ATANTOWER_016988 [Ataeniobius toweri]|uniref:Uncharacterized protein n=1 Tax=Ataeniobius toweri TaxID=208326 RepID=A0ABU7C819_9TELE|nr:hypothetical protein [Ataeniobius toweri]